MSQVIKNKIKQFIATKTPFALFRNSLDSKIKLFFQNDDTIHRFIDFNQTGFLLKPFILSQIKQSYIIQDDFKEVYEIQLKNYSLEKTLQDQINDQKEIRTAYLSMIQEAQKTITTTSLDKVVLSRKEKIQLPESFSSIDYFFKLISFFQNAFVYYVFHPHLGSWIGASPELLLKRDRDQITSMALAGTRQIDHNDKSWEKKEQMEFNFVSQTLDQVFQSEDIYNVKKSNVNTQKIGIIEHQLKMYYAQVRSSFDNLQFIDQIHPTPAICGSNRKAALNFILKHEKHDRKFYSGLIGEIQTDEQYQMNVNLRCAEIIDDAIFFYVGAGITSESIPQKEWEETKMKLFSLHNLVFN